MSTTTTAPVKTFTAEDLKKSAKRAFGGGISGAAAMGVQVCSLMWLRTVMNYQYRHGTSTSEAFKALYKEGGVLRFYRGLTPALLQGPLSRFGDTAANAGVLALLDSNPATRDLPVAAKTAAASFGAGLWRIVLMPIDTLKTSLQVSGKEGLPLLRAKLAKHGPTTMFHGALAASGATMVGHFPWFFTFNYLQSVIPKPRDDELAKKLGRNAVIGFVSSVVSDTTSNSVRVVKTYRQTHAEIISYPQAVKDVVAKDGVIGLFGRGLQTRILANGMQGLMFSVLWRLIDDHLQKKQKEKEAQ